jgi:hypothetical protein
MTTAFDLPFTLEVANGASAIVMLYFVVYLAIHIVRTHEIRNLTFRKWFHDRPLGIEVAMALMITTVGWSARSIMIWYWRLTGTDHGNFITPSPDAGSWLLLGATLIIILGYLCKIRVFSRPVYGNGPWIMALASVLAYLAFAIITR